LLLMLLLHPLTHWLLALEHLNELLLMDVGLVTASSKVLCLHRPLLHALFLLHGTLLILVDLSSLLIAGQVVQGAGSRHVRLLVELWVGSDRLLLIIDINLCQLLLGLLLWLEHLILLHGEHVL
jgi:hypothetical protein